METGVRSADMLSRFIVLKSDNKSSVNGYAHYNEDGLVLLGEDSVFSPLVKIEVEPDTIMGGWRYVSLRFCHSNKYWARQSNGRYVVAESDQPEEDTTKSSCTLFEVVKVVGEEDGSFYLTHVQSGGRLLFDPITLFFYINSHPKDNQGYLRFGNWETLIKLPKHVAFRGYNGRYLGEVSLDGFRYLQFSFADPNAEEAGHEVHLMPDGHVRIRSKFSYRKWRRIPNWIWADSAASRDTDTDALFWPQKIDDTTIALRNAGNDRYCRALTAQGKTDCLNADGSTITNESRLRVEELVLERKIYNVRYRMEDARIFDERPFDVGTAAARNYGHTEAGIPVEVGYSYEKSYSFSRSVSLTAGVKTSIECSLPFIEKGKIEANSDINTTLEWNDTTTSRIYVYSTDSVRVPPGGTVNVRCVATMGTCDVPFSYTQQDRRSTDGAIIETEHNDGVFRGTNAYNFTINVV